MTAFEIHRPFEINVVIRLRGGSQTGGSLDWKVPIPGVPGQGVPGPGVPRPGNPQTTYPFLANICIRAHGPKLVFGLVKTCICVRRISDIR